MSPGDFYPLPKTLSAGVSRRQSIYVAGRNTDRTPDPREGSREVVRDDYRFNTTVYDLPPCRSGQTSFSPETSGSQRWDPSVTLPTKQSSSRVKMRHSFSDSPGKQVSFVNLLPKNRRNRPDGKKSLFVYYVSFQTFRVYVANWRNSDRVTRGSPSKIHPLQSYLKTNVFLQRNF